MSGKYAVLMDGGFVKKKLHQKTGTFPNAAAVQTEVDRIKGHARLSGCELLRVYFYDAPPANDKLKNPVSGAVADLTAHAQYAQNVSLQQTLELHPDFAIRMGDTAVRGWKLGESANKNLQKSPRVPVAGDFVPNIQQKRR